MSILLQSNLTRFTSPTDLPTLHLLGILACAIGLLACLFVVRRAIRWNQAGDSPHCAKCEFNLTGRPEGAKVCSECGSDLSKANAIQQGTRHPSWVAIGVMASIALLCGYVGWRLGQDVKWPVVGVRFVPTAQLVSRVERRTADQIHVRELDRRIQADSLEGADLERAVKALWALTGTARPSVRAGDQLPAEVLIAPCPTLTFHHTHDHDPPKRYHVFRSLVRYRIGTSEWTEAGHFWQPKPLATIRREGYSLKTPATLPAGQHEVELVMGMRVVRVDPPAPSSGSAMSIHESESPPSAIVAWEQAIRMPITVLPAGSENDVTFVADEKLRAAVHGSIRFRLMADKRWRPSEATAPGQPERRRPLHFAYKVTASPVAFGFDVIFSHPDSGVAWKAEPLNLPAGSSVHRSDGTTFPTELSADPPTHLTVTLRPSREVARRWTWLTNIWGEEIVFENVPISPLGAREPSHAPSAPATRPASAPATP